MASKLRIVWQDGVWNHEAQMPTEQADLDRGVSMSLVGDTLVFKDGNGIVLAVNESRLVSASRVEVNA